MAVDERSRHELYLWFEQAAGRERADTLMSLLPPVGWADVATKTDVDHLRVATKTDLESLENRVLLAVRGETRTLLFALVSVVVAVASLTYAAVRLG